MSHISRRDALTGISGTGIAALLGSPNSVVGAEALQGIEAFVVGPFLLGEMYRKATADRGPGGPFAIGADPGRDKLIAALNECQLFIIDARDRTDPKKFKFAGGKRGFPLLVVGGKMDYDWKEDKKSFSSRVMSARAATNHTNYDKPVPIRAVITEVRLEFRGSTGVLDAACVYSMSPADDLTYDLDGKHLRG